LALDLYSLLKEEEEELIRRIKFNNKNNKN